MALATLVFFTAAASCAPSSIALTAASERKRRLLPAAGFDATDADAEVAETLEAAVAAVVTDAAGTELAVGDVGSLAKYAVIGFGGISVLIQALSLRVTLS